MLMNTAPHRPQERILKVTFRDQYAYAVFRKVNGEWVFVSAGKMLAWMQRESLATIRETLDRRKDMGLAWEWLPVGEMP
jgi:hypothetical protein